MKYAENLVGRVITRRDLRTSNCPSSPNKKPPSWHRSVFLFVYLRCEEILRFKERTCAPNYILGHYPATCLILLHVYIILLYGPF